MKSTLRHWYRSYRQHWYLLPLTFNIIVLIGVMNFPASARAILLITLLVTSTITDLLWKRIPNTVLLSAFVWALSLSVNNLGFALMGTAVGFAAMLALHVVFRGGEGDVKLLGVLGAILGQWATLNVMQSGFIFAAIVAIVVMAIRRFDGDRPLLAATLPMAPCFALGVLEGFFHETF